MENVPTGSLFNYGPWGGECIVEWHGDDIWLRRTDANFNATRCFKTQNGDGLKLANLRTVVNILWDNTDYHEAYMPDRNTIAVRHGNTLYSFELIPVIPADAKFNYGPWGGECVVEWHGDDLWLRRTDANFTATRCFKTQNGDGRRLTHLYRVVNILWDNVGYHEAYMPDRNTIAVRHGDTLYYFKRI